MSDKKLEEYKVDFNKLAKEQKTVGDSVHVNFGPEKQKDRAEWFNNTISEMTGVAPEDVEMVAEGYKEYLTQASEYCMDTAEPILMKDKKKVRVGVPFDSYGKGGVIGDYNPKGNIRNVSTGEVTTGLNARHDVKSYTMQPYKKRLDLRKQALRKALEKE